MFGFPFVHADRDRVEQFGILSRTQNLFGDFEVWRDQQGILWTRKRYGRHCFAVTLPEHCWDFNADFEQRWANNLAARHRLGQSFNAEILTDMLSQITQELRFEHNSERLLWAIHQAVLRANRSIVHMPDRLLARAIWGSNETAYPRNWRRTLLTIFGSLVKIQVAVLPDDGEPVLGQESLLLMFARDMLGSEHDSCDDDCPWFDGPVHSHFRIVTGPGFLGVLDQFASQIAPNGIRTYDFRLDGPTDEGPTLRAVGSTGRLVPLYLPAKLGDRGACRKLSPAQRRLLQLIVAETTYATTGNRHGMAEPDVFTGNEIQGIQVTDPPIPCPQLEAGHEYVGFNGCGARHGIGYVLAGLDPNGWLSKSGHDHLQEFFTDLAALSRHMGLIPVGVHSPSRACYDLKHLRALVRKEDGYLTLATT